MSPSGIPSATMLAQGAGKLPEPRTPPKFKTKSPPSPTVSPVVTPNVSAVANVSEITNSASKSGDELSPPSTPTGVSSNALRPGVITETIESRTTYGDYDASYAEAGGKPGGKSSKTPGTPKSPKGKDGAKSPKVSTASKSKVKSSSKPKSPKPKSPKGGGGKAKSPSRAKIPKGSKGVAGSSRLKDLLVSDVVVTPEKSDVKHEPMSPDEKPTPGFATSTPLLASRSQARLPSTAKLIDESSKGAEDSPEPKLVIDEVAAKQKEKDDAQKLRLAR